MRDGRHGMGALEVCSGWPEIASLIARSGFTVTRLLCFRYHTKMN
jgi:hypothetical protein